MFAAKATARRAARLRRNFATVVDTAGFKLAAVDNGQPTSAVTFLIKAGSRYEPKPGLSHILKNFAFKATAKRSALGTVREAEYYGGVLSSSLSREHIAFTAEFLRGDEQYFVDALSSLVASSKFTPWEFSESVLPTVEAESLAASSNPATRAIELAHATAFRSGLGASVYAPLHTSFSTEEVKAFAASAFAKGNIAILGTGIAQSKLESLVAQSLGSVSSSASAPTSAATKYHGGEARFESRGGPQTLFIGFGAAGAPSSELAVLSSHLSPKPSIKWSQGISAIATSLPAGVSVQSVYLPYSDASLLGFVVQAPTAAGVTEGGKAVVKALKDAAGGVKAEELKTAAAKAKFTAASTVEAGEGLIQTFGPQLLAGSTPTLESVFSSLDGVTASAFTKAASDLIKNTPTFVAVGELNSLPYKDEVGL